MYHPHFVKAETFHMQSVHSGFSRIYTYDVTWKGIWRKLSRALVYLL